MKYSKATLLFITVLFVGCGPKSIENRYVDVVPDEIKDLIKSHYSKSIYAVGCATGPEEAIAINRASMQARAELARQFQTEIGALQKDYEETINMYGTGEYSQVMQVFSSIKLNGSRIAKTMIRKENKKNYKAKVLIVVSAQKFKAMVDEKMRNYTSYKATNAYKALEKRVEKENELEE